MNSLRAHMTAGGVLAFGAAFCGVTLIGWPIWSSALIGAGSGLIFGVASFVGTARRSQP